MTRLGHHIRERKRTRESERERGREGRNERLHDATLTLSSLSYLDRKENFGKMSETTKEGEKKRKKERILRPEWDKS